MKYYKGITIDEDREMVFQVYDEMQNDVFDDKFIAIVTDVCKGNHAHIETLDRLEEEYYLAREITENEYNFYCTAGRLITEIWMHDFTGGFPRDTTAIRLESRLRKYLTGILDDFKTTV